MSEYTENTDTDLGGPHPLAFADESKDRGTHVEWVEANDLAEAKALAEAKLGRPMREATLYEVLRSRAAREQILYRQSLGEDIELTDNYSLAPDFLRQREEVDRWERVYLRLLADTTGLVEEVSQSIDVDAWLKDRDRVEGLITETRETLGIEAEHQDDVRVFLLNHFGDEDKWICARCKAFHHHTSSYCPTNPDYYGENGPE